MLPVSDSSLCANEATRFHVQTQKNIMTRQSQSKNQTQPDQAMGFRARLEALLLGQLHRRDKQELRQDLTALIDEMQKSIGPQHQLVATAERALKNLESTPWFGMHRDWISKRGEHQQTARRQYQESDTQFSLPERVATPILHHSK